MLKPEIVRASAELVPHDVDVAWARHHASANRSGMLGHRNRGIETEPGIQRPRRPSAVSFRADTPDSRASTLGQEDAFAPPPWRREASSVSSTSNSSQAMSSVWKGVAGMELEGLFLDDEPFSLRKYMACNALAAKAYFGNVFKTVTPIALAGFLVGWAAFSVAGILAVRSYRTKDEQDARDRIAGQAALLADLISNELYRALGVLDTIDLFMRMALQSQVLLLPSRIKDAPFVGGAAKASHRDLTGVDTSALQAELAKLYPVVKLHAPSMRAIQLAPRAVVSASYPFESNQAVLGLDLLCDVNSVGSAIAAIESDGFTVVGPIKLMQGGEAVIGRLPIFLEPETAQGMLSIRELELAVGRKVSVPASRTNLNVILCMSCLR